MTGENNEDYKNITGDGIDEVLKSYTMEKNHLEENNTYNRRLLKVVKIIHLLNRFRKHNKEYRKLIDKPEKTTFELQCLADLGKEMKREWELCLQYKAFDVVRVDSYRERSLKGEKKPIPIPIPIREDLNRIQTQFDDLITQMTSAKIVLAKIEQGDDDDFSVNFHKDSTKEYREQ